MPRVGFEPTILVFEWARTVYALDCGDHCHRHLIIISQEINRCSLFLGIMGSRTQSMCIDGEMLAFKLMCEASVQVLCKECY
jgi:hypothetical protein